MKKPMMLKVLDEGSSFVFKCVSPVLIFSLIALPFLIEYDNWTRVAIVVAVEVFCLLLLLTLYDPSRFNWALRGMCGIVSVFYLVFTLEALMPGFAEDQSAEGVGVRKLLTAFAVFFMIVLPCFSYAIGGRHAFPMLARNQNDSNDDGS